MPSTLPTESTLPKQVDTWGIGTYDSQRDEEGDHGENSEAHEPAGRTLPDDATKSSQIEVPGNGAGDEEWLSYPNEPESRTVSYPVSVDTSPVSEMTMRLGPLPNGVLPPDHVCDEDCEHEPPIGDAQPANVFNPDRSLIYPDGDDGRLGTLMHRGFIAVGLVPGDQDANIQHFHPKTDVYDARVETVAEATTLPQEQGVDGRDPGAIRPKGKKVSEEHSELPVDGDNPAARTDYYDYMHPGHTGSSRRALFTDYVAPTQDSGAYTSQKEKVSDSALPTVMKNEETMDDFLQSLGNWLSGKEIEDVSGPYGFPATDFDENINFDRSDNQDGGTQLPGADVTGDRVTMFASGGLSMNSRQATNINQVVALTKDFLKEAGKKGLTKRHVLAFLQSRGLPQYLSSDIIRCLKLSHNVFVKDVLDEFPVARAASTAGNTTVARVRNKLIDLECRYVLQPEVAGVLRRLAANLTRALIDMDRIASDGSVKEAEKCYDDAMKESTKTAYEAYCKSCRESGQSCMSHDEWLKGMKSEPVKERE
jgi:hypothetical protein